MSVAVRDARATGPDRAWIESVYREYLDDLSSPNTGLFPSLGEVGHGTAEQFGRWYADRNVQILTILRGATPAGFAVVAPGERLGAPPHPDFRMAEFFIARAMRRLGVGAAAAPLIFDRFAGRWEILEHSRNRLAVGFWRKVVARYTKGKFEERVVNGDVRQRFATGPSRIANRGL
jgi:predicted acetyltransferase